MTLVKVCSKEVERALGEIVDACEPVLERCGAVKLGSKLNDPLCLQINSRVQYTESTMVYALRIVDGFLTVLRLSFAYHGDQITISRAGFSLQGQAELLCLSLGKKWLKHAKLLAINIHVWQTSI